MIRATAHEVLLLDPNEVVLFVIRRIWGCSTQLIDCSDPVFLSSEIDYISLVELVGNVFACISSFKAFTENFVFSPAGALVIAKDI